MPRVHWGPWRSPATSLHGPLRKWQRAPAMASEDKICLDSSQPMHSAMNQRILFLFRTYEGPVSDSTGWSWPSCLPEYLHQPAERASSELLPTAGCLLHPAGTSHLMLEPHFYRERSSRARGSLLRCPHRQDGGIFSLAFERNSHSLPDVRL